MTLRTTSKRGWSIKCGVQLRPRGRGGYHDFPDSSNIYFLFFTMRTGPFSKCENRSDSQMGYQVRTWTVLTGRISPPERTFNPVLLTVDISGEPVWKPVSGFSQWVRTAQHWKLAVLGSSGSGSSKTFRMDPMPKKIGTLVGSGIENNNSGSDSRSGNQTQFQFWFWISGSENGG